MPRNDHTLAHGGRSGHAARVALFATVLAFGGTAPAATLDVLHGFPWYPGSGCTRGHPWNFGYLAQGRDGNVYGTAPSGGATNIGTAFKIGPDGGFTKLHDFDYYDEGHPTGLTLGKDGNFYGATHHGGAYGQGAIFKMTPAGVVTTLHSLNPAVGEGGWPYAPPVQGRDGSLYGPTTVGGANGYGSVYKIKPSGAFSTVYSFESIDNGWQPWAPLIEGKDGAFYGTTEYGGGRGQGTVFKLTAAGVATVLYRFDDEHGHFPHGGVIQGSDGNLYGTTIYGGLVGAVGDGVVYKLTLKGQITLLHHFDASTPEGQAEGYWPYAGLVQGSDGNFYGATQRGGEQDVGALFRLTPSGEYTVLASFDNAPGHYPHTTPLLHTNGKVYGLSDSNTSTSCGTLYRLDAGAPSFVAAIPSAAKAGTTVGLLGALGGTSAVTFNGVNASFSGSGGYYRKAVVPPGPATGPLAVATSAGPLQTLKPFQQLPTLTGSNPGSGAVGSAVVLTGTGLAQTTSVKFGGGKAASFVVNGNNQLTATVPAGAVDGKIAVTTSGGTVRTPAVFDVIP